MGWFGFETPEENYQKAKARYVEEHGPIKNPKPVKHYSDGFYDPNIGYFSLKTKTK